VGGELKSWAGPGLLSPCGVLKLLLCQGKCILLVACKTAGNESFCCRVMEMENAGKWQWGTENGKWEMGCQGKN